MRADVVSWVYCEHDGCEARHEAILRYTSFRGKDRFRVVSFVTFTSTGWMAWVSSEDSCYVRCPLHEYKGYMSSINYLVRS